MTDHELHEFRSLREAVAGRGQLRVALTLGGLVSWAVILTSVLVALPYPLAAVIPLATLVATFEVIRPLHFGAERIGRYLQVFYEEAGLEPGAPLAAPAWERTAFLFGATVPGAAGHPLFLPLFVLATIVNTLAVMQPGPTNVELAIGGSLHVAFIAWLTRADRAMRGQRRRELTRFRELHGSAQTARPGEPQ